MSKQTQLPWAASSSSSRGQRVNGGSSRDDRDIDMREQPAAHLKDRTIYRANRSHSVTPGLHAAAVAPQHAAAPSTVSSGVAAYAMSLPVSSSPSVLGKRGGGRPSPFVFLDGEQPLDYTDFAQCKLPVHTLLYLCADEHYANKHVTQPTDETEAEHSDRHDSGSAGNMETMENGKEEKAEQPNSSPPQPAPSIRYDAIASADDDSHQSATLFSHHPFHRLHRSYKAALSAWKQRQPTDDQHTAATSSGRVMEFACREPLHVLLVSAEQRVAIFGSATVSSASSSTVGEASYVPSPPALLSHLLSTHNGCVGYEVEGDETAGIVMTSNACECQLSLLDDDKRPHVSQALLTDMFARLHC